MPTPAPTSSRSSIGWPARALSSATLMASAAEVTVYLVAYDVLNALGRSRVWRAARLRRRSEVQAPATTVDRLEAALRVASAFYVRPVKCLQRAVAAAWFLRARGCSCALVIGAHVARKEAHAWIEIGPRIVGDPKRLRRFFKVLTRT